LYVQGALLEFLMAKLEQLVTPSELLKMIKDGALKSEILKKFKASDQDLAMMLYPVYRGGELTKEEFNDFFNETHLRKDTRDEPPAIADEPPSVIVKNLAAMEKAENKRKRREEAKEPAVFNPPAENEEETPPDIPEMFNLILKRLKVIEKRIVRLEKKLTS
jgi:hypothetical protein